VAKEEIDSFHLLRALFVGYTSKMQMDYEINVCNDIIKKYGGGERRTRPSDESWILPKVRSIIKKAKRG
jgi:hypothetical protein